ncbi:MAG: hypothetical protein JXA61_01505 [Bacteroidales bacterium]|nr:hypothetical protein [Bacteroidales bacterium]
MIIKNETTSDIGAISKVTIAAFKTLPISNHTEQFIIHALRDADALTISLVAEIEVFLVLPFDKKIPQGTVVFHKGFLANEPGSHCQISWLQRFSRAAKDRGLIS